MAQDDVDAALDRLYGVPLEEFVAERTRLARELRSAGERSAADRVAKLPKPSAAAWALNLVGREAPDSVAAWIDASAALREASTRPTEVGGDTLRTAMAQHRAATARLIDDVRRRAQPGGRPLSEAMLDRVRALLQSATADAELAERLAAGHVTDEKQTSATLPEPASDGGPGRDRGAAARRVKPDPEAAAPTLRRAAGRGRDAAATAAQREGESGAKPADGRARRERAAAARREALERDASVARGEVERLDQEAALRREAAELSDSRLEEARRALRRAESEAAAARDARKDLERARAVAERRLRQLDARLRRAGGSG